MKPTVSIITVCYNAEKTIENTICSILQQSFTGYEYIIIDGQSEDGTNDIIQKYLSAFADRGITVKYISEKDDGIYYIELNLTDKPAKHPVCTTGFKLVISNVDSDKSGELTPFEANVYKVN